MGLKSQSYLPICFENQTDGEIDFEWSPGSGGGSGSGVGIFIYIVSDAYEFRRRYDVESLNIDLESVFVEILR